MKKHRIFVGTRHAVSLLEKSQDTLSQWAAEALTEHRAGKTIPV